MSITRIPGRFAFTVTFRIATALAVAFTLAVAPRAIAQVGGTVILRVTDAAGAPQQFLDVALEGIDGNTFSRTALVR